MDVLSGTFPAVGAIPSPRGSSVPRSRDCLPREGGRWSTAAGVMGRLERRPGGRRSILSSFATITPSKCLLRSAYVRHRSTAPSLSAQPEYDLASIASNSDRSTPAPSGVNACSSSATPWMPSYYPAWSPLLPSFLLSRISIFVFPSTFKTGHTSAVDLTFPNLPSIAHLLFSSSFSHNSLPWAVSRLAMCEPHSAGGWSDSPSKAPPHDEQPSAPSTRIAADKAKIIRPDPSTSIISPISPPSSPPTPYHAFQPLRPVDVLASQLRKYSLEHYRQYDSTLGASPTSQQSAALSPASLPDDDFVNVQSLVSGHGSPSADIDIDVDMGANDDLVGPEKSAHLEIQGASVSSSSRAITPSSRISSLIRSSPIAVDPAVDPTALLEARSHGSRTVYRPDFDDLSQSLEVDEGYCEDDDDFAWLESAISLRAAGTPGGITKRYGLRYRTSAEAASRCSNSIHSVPRMRRRDKKRRKQSQPPDASAIGTSDPSSSNWATTTH
ncbi:hypothetical protein ACJZ2D_007792 [Fusarium nematophilum]